MADQKLVAPYLGVAFFSTLFDNTFIELLGSNLKIWEKARNLSTFLTTPKQGKTNMQHNAQPVRI